MIPTVRDAPPPASIVAVLNPVLRVLLRTPLGRLVKPFALLEFVGRRSGKRYRIPVGWYESGGVGLVFTPAVWRANFDPSAAAKVCYRGRLRNVTGILVSDPAAVAESLDSLLRGGVSPKLLGLEVPEGHRITADNVRDVRRALIEFRTM